MGKWKKVVILVQIDICWYLNRPIANTMQVVQLDEHPGIEEKLCRYKSMKRVKNKPHNVVPVFGIYQWRKTSAPSTSSLGPWIYLWSYSATLTTGFKSSVIAVLFSVTLCLGTVSTGWKRLQLESWQTCSVMRKSFWELWRSRGIISGWNINFFRYILGIWNIISDVFQVSGKAAEAAGCKGFSHSLSRL